MGWKCNAILLLFGAVCIEKGMCFKVPERTFKESVGADEGSYNKLEEGFQKQIDEIWKRYTREDVKPPSFYSNSFNSTIIGKEMETINGRTIYAFQGFKYGKEPNINTRFKPPVPAGKFWKGDTFTANHIGFKCPQYAMIGHNTAGDEDCLNLNVYTPYVPSKDQKLLPVMFFIHGGAFTSGDTSMYLPTKLLDFDVILVTIHYRLGALGFFSLNNNDAPGNAALYDMVEALRWTQNYIGDFGGDKDKVTIFGESAGSVSVNYMMFIPAAREMFRGVIAESGSALDHWAIDENPRYAAEYIANYLQCPTENDKDLFNCIVTKDAADLVRAEGSLVGDDRHNGLIGFRGAAPSVQTVTLSPEDNFEILVTKRPRDYFRDGDFAKVPFMTGSNKQEGSYVLGIMYGDFFRYNGLDENVTYMREEMIQDILKSYDVFDDTYSLANSLTSQYCPGIDLGGDFNVVSQCLIDLVGVMYLKAGSWETANLHSYYSDKLTFYYSFDFESDDSMYIWLLGTPPFDPGVTHSDELMYLFSMPALMDTKEQNMTMHRMTKLWTNFAIYGDPTPEEERDNLSSLNLPTWTPYKFEDHHYLLMQNEFTVEKEYTDRWTITVDEMRMRGTSELRVDRKKWRRV